MSPTELFQGAPARITIPIILIVPIVGLIFWGASQHAAIAGLEEDIDRIESARFTVADGVALALRLEARLDAMEARLGAHLGMLEREILDLCHDLGVTQTELEVIRTNNCDTRGHER